MQRRQEWTDLVRRAYDAGVAVLTVVNHFGSSGGIFPSLLAAAYVAPTMRVGTLVLNNDFWHPCLLAREVITADVLTDGRFELGLGAGWNEADYRAIGQIRAPGGQRIAKLAEAIQILQQALAGGPVRFHGAFYDVEADMAPRHTRQHLPLLVGGGSRTILELAGRSADIVSIHRNLSRGSLSSWEQARGPDPVAEKLNWVRAAAGARFEHMQLHSLIQRCVITTHRHDTAATLGAPLGLEAEDVLGSPHFLVGTVDELREDLIARRERWGIDYWTLVGPQDLESFSSVIAGLRDL